MQSGHRAGHVVTDGISVEAAVDLPTLVEQGAQPAWVGPGAGGGQATVLGMESKATDRIDGRLTENERWASFGGNGEEARVFLRADRQTTPTPLGGAAQLGTDRDVSLSQEQENGVGPGVGVESAQPDQRLKQRGGDGALSDQVVFHALELAGI